ncbi:CLUMA_CG015347, isoform A, partial [Clunio marinus]
MDFQISVYTSLGSCLALSILYVSSLYVWSSEENRDHPSTVKKRFFSVFVVMLISPFFVYLFSSPNMFNYYTIWEVMGLRTKGLMSAVFIPLLLTMILFLGPLSVQLTNGIWKIYSEPMFWLNHCQNLLWIRNHIVAPLSEEFTFRACMLPLLLQSFTPITSIFITPMFFGVAHLHHMIERLRTGMDKKTAIVISFFQFFYTSIFGIYSAYLFMRTGHFVAPFIVHAFCNHMGFPDIPDLINQTEPKRCIFCLLYILGLVGWILLLPTMTYPSWYQNNQFWMNSSDFDYFFIMKSNTNIAIICFSTITVIFASKSDTSAINIPSFIKICNQTDPQLGNCIRNSIITLRPYLNRGIPELNVPSLEPLFVDEIKIEQTGNGMELSAAFKNISLSGVTRFRLRSVRTNITTGKFRMKVWFPNLVLNATYELRGKLLMMPLNGKGACFGNFTDIDGVLSMKINRVERNSQQYYQIDFISSEFNIGS